MPLVNETEPETTPTAVRAIKRDDIVYDEFWECWRSVDFIGPADYHGHIKLSFRYSDAVHMPADFQMPVLNPNSRSLFACITRFVVSEQEDLELSKTPGRFLRSEVDETCIKIFSSKNRLPIKNDPTRQLYRIIGGNGLVFKPTKSGTPGKKPIKSVYNPSACPS